MTADLSGLPPYFWREQGKTCAAVPANNSFLSLSVCCRISARFFVDFPHRIGHPAAEQAKAGQENVQGFPAQASVDARHAAGGPRMPPPHRRPGRHAWHRPFRLPDAGPAVFPCRTPSLPRSGRQVRGGGDPVMARNLRPLSGVGRAPSDTWMRQRLDGAGPRDLRRRLAERFWRGGRCPAAIRWSPSTAPGTIPPAVPAASAAASGSAATGRGHTITRPLGPRPSIPASGRCCRWRRSRSAGGTARRGPAPGAPAHEGDRRRGRAGVQRAAQQAIEAPVPP